MIILKYNFLFNFAVSFSGGGFKRLYEYARWFNQNGGAYFVIHSSCENLVNEFPKNKYFLATQPRYTRVFNDCSYLDIIGDEIGQPDFYYSYGIPIYAPFGKINWFHLSNVLPLGSGGIPLPLFDRLKLIYLGFKIKRNFKNADVISAESNYSLSLIDIKENQNLFLSVNGSDDELIYLHKKNEQVKDSIATVLGTYSYKALKDSFYIFEMLRKIDANLKLIIIGDDKAIPHELRNNKNIIPLGVLPRSGVIEQLRKTKYYISTTLIENSYNAASEGMFFADESYISDIGPHRELLVNIPFNQISISDMIRPVLHVKRENLSILNLKNWEQVITEMIDEASNRLRTFH